MSLPKNRKKRAVEAAAAEVATPADAEFDAQCETLLTQGLVRSKYTFESEGSLMVPSEMALPRPWNLPSRMFRHPIEMTKRIWNDPEPRRFGLMHPLLGPHPFVRQVEEVLGIRIEPGGTPNKYGHSNTKLALWWHAVDLVSSGHWEDLMETLEFTTTDSIVGAIGFGLFSRGRERLVKGKREFTVHDARRMLRALGVSEPAGGTVLKDVFMTPSPCSVDKKKPRFPVNHRFNTSSAQQTWGTIHCIENGTFVHDSTGFLAWSERGVARFETVTAPGGKTPAATGEARTRVTMTTSTTTAPKIVEKNGQSGFDF